MPGAREENPSRTCARVTDNFSWFKRCVQDDSKVDMARPRFDAGGTMRWLRLRRAGRGRRDDEAHVAPLFKNKRKIPDAILHHILPNS